MCGIYSTADKVIENHWKQKSQLFLLRSAQHCILAAKPSAMVLTATPTSPTAKRRRNKEGEREPGSLVDSRLRTRCLGWCCPPPCRHSCVKVFTMWKEAMCGASLVNSRFLLTAAHCPCKEGLCTRGMMELGDKPLRIQVGWRQGSEQKCW